MNVESDDKVQLLICLQCDCRFSALAALRDFAL